MKNIITVGFMLLSVAVNAQNIKLGECKSTQEYLKQALECYYIPQWNTPKDSVDLHLKQIEALSGEIDRKTNQFMEKKYTEAYLGKMTQDYATKIGSSPDAILAMSEATESMQSIGAKLAELNTEMELELGKLKPLEDIYHECGLNIEIHFSGLYDAKVDQNRKTYKLKFPDFYNKAIARQKQEIVLRKSHFEAALKLQYELVGVLQKKYDSSKMMMLEQFLDQQKVGCYLLIKEHIEVCKKLCKPYQMYQLKD